MALNVKKFQKFLAEKGEDGDITSLNINYLGALLAIFLKNLRKPNGDHYEAVTVAFYSSTIQRYLAENMVGVNSETSFPTSKAALGVKKVEGNGQGDSAQ